MIKSQQDSPAKTEYGIALPKLVLGFYSTFVISSLSVIASPIGSACMFCRITIVGNMCNHPGSEHEGSCLARMLNKPAFFKCLFIVVVILYFFC